MPTPSKRTPGPLRAPFIRFASYTHLRRLRMNALPSDDGAPHTPRPSDPDIRIPCRWSYAPRRVRCGNKGEQLTLLAMPQHTSTSNPPPTFIGHDDRVCVLCMWIVRVAASTSARPVPHANYDAVPPPTAAAEAHHRTARIPAVPRLAQCRLSAGASPHAGTCIPSHARRANASGPSGSADFARRCSIWRRPSRWIRPRRRERRCTAPPVPGVDGARAGGDATARWVRFASARRARSSWRRAGWRSYASRHDVDFGHGGCAAQTTPS
ncbi:hypothetical protein VTO73DRAFT_6864 [Trametes versicolor]